LGYFDKLISQLEDESKKLAVGSEEYKKVIVLLEKYKNSDTYLGSILVFYFYFEVQ
jgi:iron uptake system EfeUOB component EfeO/EfeM